MPRPLSLKHILLAAVFLFAFSGFGCNSTDPDEEVTTKPLVDFKGETDQRFVGKWKVDTGNTTYTFKQDGTYTIVGTITNRGQVMQNNSAGSWLVNGDRFLIKDAQTNVVPYTYAISGKKLTLALTGAMKASTTMIRQD